MSNKILVTILKEFKKDLIKNEVDSELVDKFNFLINQVFIISNKDYFMALNNKENEKLNDYYLALTDEENQEIMESYIDDLEIDDFFIDQYVDHDFDFNEHYIDDVMTEDYSKLFFKEAMEEYDSLDGIPSCFERGYYKDEKKSYDPYNF